MSAPEPGPAPDLGPAPGPGPAPDLGLLRRRVAAFGLPARIGAHPPDAAAPPIADAPLDEQSWAGLLRHVERVRITGLLHAAVQAGALPVTDEQAADLDDAHLRWCATSVQLERILLDLVARLEAADIEAVVLKGTAHAHLLYPDPGWRMFGDNDVLVPAQDFARTVQVLAAAGYERPVPEARPGFDARFGKGATLRRPGADELDLHRSLVFGTFGFVIDHAELFASTTTFVLGGRRLRALGPDTRLLHSCYHAALGDPVPRPGSVRDVAQQFAAGAYDPDRVLALMRAWRATAVVKRALLLCRHHLDVEVAGPIAEAARSHQVTRREQRAIASYVGHNRRFAAKVVASLPYVDGVGDKARFAWAMALPAEPFAQVRGTRPGMAWVRRGVRGALGREQVGGSQARRDGSARRRSPGPSIEPRREQPPDGSSGGEGSQP